jgi:hypothetical protein
MQGALNPLQSIAAFGQLTRSFLSGWLRVSISARLPHTPKHFQRPMGNF